jgi:hypothetical protein
MDSAGVGREDAFLIWIAHESDALDPHLKCFSKKKEERIFKKRKMLWEQLTSSKASYFRTQPR